MNKMSNLRNCSSKQNVSCICAAISTNWHHKCNIDFVSNVLIRHFSRSSCLTNRKRNFYDDLGISKTSTQSDIKAAYYNLSKTYHPDKNKGCEKAAEKFRLVSEAYEVLGNFRSRRMYDKGIGSFGKAAYSAGTASEIIFEENEEEEDDAQTKFYKQHMKRSQLPTMADRPTAREFDDWASRRITESFHRNQRGKEKVKDVEYIEKSNDSSLKAKNNVLIVALFSVVVGIFYATHTNELTYEKLKKKT